MVKEMDKDYTELKKKLVGQWAKMAALLRGSGEKEDMEKELETLQQQVVEPMRKIMWVEKSPGGRTGAAVGVCQVHLRRDEGS